MASAADPRAVLVCGEALVDLMPVDPDDELGDTWRALPGGSPFNTAIALSRLRVPVQYLGRVGDDGFGLAVRRRIARTEVDDRLLVRTPDPTTVALVNLDRNRNATYTFYWEGSSNAGWQAADLPEPAAWHPAVHIGSLAAVLKPSDTVLYDWFAGVVTGGHGPVTYDLNVRPAVLADIDEYRERCERFVALATVVKGSDEDLAHLYPDTDVADVAAGWFAQTELLDTVVVTGGSEGSRVFHRDGTGFTMPTLDVEVVDTVGAGDTFMAGYLHGRFVLGEQPEDAVRRATVAGALVCTRRGAEPPTGLEVDQVLAARSDRLPARRG